MASNGHSTNSATANTPQLGGDAGSVAKLGGGGGGGGGAGGGASGGGTGAGGPLRGKPGPINRFRERPAPARFPGSDPLGTSGRWGDHGPMGAGERLGGSGRPGDAGRFGAAAQARAEHPPTGNFAAAIHQDGLVVLPVQEGPPGAFTIQRGRLAWRPAVDVNRAILGGQVVAVVALLVARAISRNALRARRARRRR